MDLAEDIRTNGNPALVIDSQGVKLLRSIRHATTWQQCAREVFSKKRNCAFIPNTAEEVGYLFSICRELGGVNVLLDEAAFWLSNRSMGPKSIEKAFRVHFHWGNGKGGIIRLTTQALADLHGVVIQSCTTMNAFRCTSYRILDRLKQEFNYKPEEVERLGRGEFIQKGAGF